MGGRNQCSSICWALLKRCLLRTVGKSVTRTPAGMWRAQTTRGKSAAAPKACGASEGLHWQTKGRRRREGSTPRARASLSCQHERAGLTVQSDSSIERRKGGRDGDEATASASARSSSPPSVVKTESRPNGAGLRSQGQNDRSVKSRTNRLSRDHKLE